MSAEPTRPSSREQVLSVARRLFSEKGYAAVSIRDIAAEAGVSPALVIKHVGTKAAMFTEAVGSTFEPSPIVLEGDREQLGEQIVRRILSAQRAGRPSPLTRAVVLILPSPDPEDMRRRFGEAYLEPLAQRLGGDESAYRRARMALAAAVGFSVSMRVFHYLPHEEHDEQTIRSYGRAIQSILDDEDA